MTFQGESEMVACKVSCKEFSVKWEYLASVGESLWEKKARGFQELRERCCRTEASVAKESSAVGKG
jgi:hypothetical protein